MPCLDWTLSRRRRWLPSHVIEDYTALETGPFGKATKCLCVIVYFVCTCVRACVSDRRWRFDNIMLTFETVR